MTPSGTTSSRMARVEKRGYTYAEALAYLGLKRRAFNMHIRPQLPAPTPCGTARVFERADLDRAWETYRVARRRTPRPGESRSS